MSHTNRKWIIITLADYTDDELQDLVNNAIQTSPDTLRRTLDGTKAILKYEGAKPRAFYGEPTYTYSQIKTELSKSEWTKD